MTKTVAMPDLDTQEAIAIAYLEAHPDLLARHPSLLAKLEIHHGAPGAVSLVERQLAVMREQIAKERQRLAILVERAREYDTLTAHLHALTTKLMLAPSVTQAREILDQEIKAEFGAAAVALITLPPSDDKPAADDPKSPTAALIKLAELGRCLCGNLPEGQYAELFGPDSDGLNSAAVIPLAGPMVRGLLAIGSQDPKHFTADMGTEVLDRLGDIVSAKLMELTMIHGD